MQGIFIVTKIWFVAKNVASATYHFDIFLSTYLQYEVKIFSIIS